MADALDGLPDDVRESITPHMPAANTATLEAISLAIAKKRDEAKAARSTSGIEQTWKEAEEAYVGIDEANRSEFTDARWSKPMSMDGPVTTSRRAPNTDYKSTAFVRLTARYVDAGASKLGEILLQPGGKSFSFSETPVPALIKAKDDNSQVVHDGMGNLPLTRPARPGEVQPQQPSPPAAPIGQPGASPAPGAPGGSPPPLAVPQPAAAPAVGAVPPAGAAGGVPLTVADLAKENIELAREKATRAEERIYDWMVESQYNAEMRKVIFDSARIGVGVLKGPVPKSFRSMAMHKKTAGGPAELQINNTIQPSYKWVDPWNIFPDQSCGENIHFGDFVLERDYLSESQVRDLKKIPGYIGTQIDKVLADGPDKTSDDRTSNSRDATTRKGRYEIWYYYGSLEANEMDCICAAADGSYQGDGKPKKQVYAIVTLINSSVVRATINPLDSGSFPYHSVPWQRRAGHWAGIGVAEQIRMPQKTVNAATRAMLNNAGKSAGSQIVVDQSAIKPADGNWIATPDKFWYKTGDSPGDDVRKAFLAIEFPNVTPQLMTIIEYGMKLAEESTSIPLITQGQSGPSTPDTFGAAQLQNNNANQLLRSIGYAFDDYITEPVVRQSYEWLLLDPEVPDDEKGDFTIDAHGSIALVEQAIQDQFLSQIGALVLNPAYGCNPRKYAELLFKSKRIDPAQIQYTKEEQARIDAQPPAPAPAVQVAQIAAQTAAQALVAKQGADQQNAASEERISQAAQVLEGGRVHAEQQRTLTEATVSLHDIASRREIAHLEYALKNNMTISQLQIELAKLDTSKQLAATKGMVELHKHHVPGAKQQQPPGNGRSAKAQ